MSGRELILNTVTRTPVMARAHRRELWQTIHIVTRRRETVFVEIQRFRQLWIWILLSAIAVITIGNLAIGMYREFVLGKPFSHGEFLSNGTWLMIWVIGVGATIGPILLLWYASYRDKPRGVTDVRNGGIR